MVRLDNRSWNKSGLNKEVGVVGHMADRQVPNILPVDFSLVAIVTSHRIMSEISVVIA